MVRPLGININDICWRTIVKILFLFYSIIYSFQSTAYEFISYSLLIAVDY